MMETTGSSDSASGKPIQYHRPSPFRVWWREFLSLFVVLGIIGAIVGILVPFQDRPLPDWPHHITINALVALLIVIAKFLIAFVLAECLGQLKWSWFEESRPLSDLVEFERASRGSLWGSLRLLWTLRGRSFLACIGAVLTVISIAIDPFTQQLIQYYSCGRVSEAQYGSISVARSWADSESYNYRNAPGLATAGYGIQGAIMNGFFSPGSTPVPFNCGTGNCTFSEPLYTLGYSSSCEDATKDIIFDAHGKIPVTQTMPVVTTDATQTQTALLIETASAQFSTYRLPSNLTARPGAIESRLLPVMPAKMNAQVAWEMNFEVIYASIGGTNGSTPNSTDTNWKIRGLGAARCNIKPCIYSLHSTISAGVLSEGIQNTFRDIPWNVSILPGNIPQLVATRTSCLDVQQRATLGSKLGQSDLPEWVGYDPRSHNDSEADIPRECYFTLEVSGTSGIVSFLTTYLTQSGFDGARLGGQVPPQLNALYRQGNTTFPIIDSTLTNMTQSMTSYFRQSSLANTTTGVMHEQTTCVNIVWKWFSFFGAICGLAFVVLLSTIVRDRRAGHDFKTDILPMIFAAKGVGQPDVSARSSGLASAMEQEVRRRRVRFGFAEDGWKFREVDGEKGDGDSGVPEQQTMLVSRKH